jgi:hypothetical protein
VIAVLAITVPAVAVVWRAEGGRVRVVARVIFLVAMGDPIVRAAVRRAPAILIAPAARVA